MVAVDADADELVVASNFQFVPLTGRFFDFVGAAETFDVVPWVAAGAIDTGDAWAFCHTLNRAVCAVDDEDVAGASFDHLALDGFGPDLIFAAAMYEDAAVASVVFARCPGF